MFQWSPSGVSVVFQFADSMWAQWCSMVCYGDVPMAFQGCRDVPVMFRRCFDDVPAVFRQYSSDAPGMLRWCSSTVDAVVFQWWVGNVMVMFRPCSGNVQMVLQGCSSSEVVSTMSRNSFSKKLGTTVVIHEVNTPMCV